MTHFRIQRMRRGLWVTGGSLAGLLLGWTGSGPLAAQSPLMAGSAQEINKGFDTSSSQRLYFNKNIIHLPIQINEQFRSQIREVQLYIKEQPGAPWTLRDSATADQRSFTFHAQHDGEYAFAMVTIDRQGKRTPADLRTEPPGLIIIIDTQLPQVELTKLGKTVEGQLVQFLARDTNLDNAKVRFFFQGGDKQFRQVEPMPQRPGVFCIPEQAVFTGIVRATAIDLAGNVTTRECHINQLTSQGQAAVVSAQETTSLPAASADTHVPNTLPMNLVKMDPVVPSSGIVLPVPATPDQPVCQPSSRTLTRPDGAEGPRFLEEPAIQHSVAKVAHTSTSVTTPALPQMAVRKDVSKRHLVNQTKMLLDYNIENAGQNAASKVEVWITRDQGKTWSKHAEDSSCKSPVEVQLPEDGLYGISLVVVNGRGQSIAPPAPGDAPDWLIEVDTTKPTVQITTLQTLQENGTTVILVGWNAQDANLGENAVDLFYAVAAQGPWLPISKGLTNQGQHRWTPPATLGAHAYVRVVAHDKAGNSAVAGTLDPIHLEDSSRPRAFIRGVRTESPTMTESN